MTNETRDIVADVRKWADGGDLAGFATVTQGYLYDMAEEIERLRKENAELRGKQKYVDNLHYRIDIMRARLLRADIKAGELRDQITELRGDSTQQDANT